MTDLEARAGENICDFCSTPLNPPRMYKCPDFTMDKSDGLPEFRSKAEWAACTACATLIDNEKWDALLARGVQCLGPKYDAIMPRRILTDVVKRSHDLFREHYYRGKQ